MAARLAGLRALVCISGVLSFVCGCTSIPERKAFEAIHRKPYDVVANNCQHKAREYAEILVRAGYDAELVRVMTRTTAHMLVQVREGDRVRWLDPTAGCTLRDLDGWSYYRIGDGPVRPVLTRLSNSEKRALGSYEAVRNGEYDAELVAVYVGNDGHWRKIPEAEWADYAIVGCGRDVCSNQP